MKTAVVFFFLCIQACFAQNSSHQSSSQNNDTQIFSDLSIVVFSCDKYQELWKPFFEMLFKSWPSLKTKNAHVPIYLVANSQKYNDPRITTVNIENEKSWSDNALTVLAQVKTKYVLILLEDYFFTRIDTKRLHDVFNFMKSHDVAYCQIAYNGTDIAIRKKAEVFPGVAEKDRYELWRTSLFACIWRTKDMAHTLKSGENIWDFEVAGNLRSQGLYGSFLTIFENQPVDYLNMVQQRYVNAAHLKIVNEMGIDFTPTKLEIDADHKIKLFFYYKVFGFAKECVRSIVTCLRSGFRSFMRIWIPSFDS
ncbi:MAG: hypothetical protein ACK4V2_03850 [Pseudomonadota bacterium]|nr:hypothetical protein [Alphaproteobacteria bacterium]